MKKIYSWIINDSGIITTNIRTKLFSTDHESRDCVEFMSLIDDTWILNWFDQFLVSCCTTLEGIVFHSPRVIRSSSSFFIFLYLQQGCRLIDVKVNKKRYAMISFTLLHFENFNFSEDLYITQLNIYDEAFIAKIVSR